MYIAGPARPLQQLWIHANPAFVGSPNFFKVITTGQMPVKDAWIRCAPIMPVNQSQFGLLKAARSALPSTIRPTISRIERSTVISNLHLQYAFNETPKRSVLASVTG